MAEKIKITLFVENEKNWVEDFIQISKKLSDVEIHKTSQLDETDQLVFLHEKEKNSAQLIQLNNSEDRVYFAVTEKKDQIPTLLKNALVEDVLVYPFRVVEVLSKLKNYQQVLMWKEMSGINEGLQKLIGQFKDDVELAARLQKLKSPKRFTPLKVFTPYYRYFAGTKPGGNYFDLMPAQQENSYSILLSDSSSYGLSSLVLSMVLNIAVKMNSGELCSPFESARMIYQDALSTLREKDKLSLFFGSLSRFNLTFNYVHYGENLFLHAKQGEDFKVIPKSDEALTLKTLFSEKQSQTIKFEPRDRFILLSQGYCGELGGESEVLKMVNSKKEFKCDDILNDLSVDLRVRLKNSKKEFPDRDCTMSFFEMNDKVAQLRKIENVS